MLIALQKNEQHGVARRVIIAFECDRDRYAVMCWRRLILLGKSLQGRECWGLFILCIGPQTAGLNKL